MMLNTYREAGSDPANHAAGLWEGSPYALKPGEIDRKSGYLREDCRGAGAGEKVSDGQSEVRCDRGNGFAKMELVS